MTYPPPAHVIDGHVGGRLRERRRELRLTLAEVADPIGVSFQQVAKYETGKAPLQVATLVAICRTLRIPVTYPFQGLADRWATAQTGRPT